MVQLKGYLCILDPDFEQCLENRTTVCRWRRLHNVLETKCIKSGGKSQFSLSFLSYTVNDVRRKLHRVGIQLTVEKRAKRMPDTTLETTSSVFWTGITKVGLITL